MIPADEYNTTMSYVFGTPSEWEEYRKAAVAERNAYLQSRNCGSIYNEPQGGDPTSYPVILLVRWHGGDAVHHFIYQDQLAKMWELPRIVVKTPGITAIPEAKMGNEIELDDPLEDRLV